MASRILVLGAGFGGLELTTILSEKLGEGVDVTIIDRSDAFILGAVVTARRDKAAALKLLSGS